MKKPKITPITDKEREDTYAMLKPEMDRLMGKVFKILGLKASAVTVIVALDAHAVTEDTPAIAAVHEKIPPNYIEQAWALDEVLSKLEGHILTGTTVEEEHCMQMTSPQSSKPKSKKKSSLKKKPKRSAKSLKSLALRKG